MKTQNAACLLAGLLSLALTDCIRPQNYHPATSTFTYEYCNDGYFYDDRVHEAYIELDARGMQFDSAQTERAIALITALRHPAGRSEQAVSVFVFVHGWKNNASEDSGNVWGFRRMLNHIANSLHTRGTGDRTTPVVGIYIGWPGAMTRSGTFLSFWSRESVANAVGEGDLSGVLEKVLVATKKTAYGDYEGISDAVLIGHSFGGLVLERAVLGILEKQLAKLAPGMELKPAADFILLLNEAGPASQAQRFLLQLLRNHIEFSEDGEPFPLVASMTSVGDPATKLAFPGSQFVSPNRPVTQSFNPLDEFGQKTSLPYNLLTTANMVALQSHEFKQVNAENQCPAGGIFVPLFLRDNGNTKVAYDRYCIQKKTPAPPQPPIDNTTPYWVMQLPQVFVPDHGSVFRDPVIDLINAFLAHRGRVNLPTAQAKEGVKALAITPPPPPPPQAIAAKPPQRHEPRLKMGTTP